MLFGEEDVLSVVIQIIVGVGGMEVCDWVFMLMCMYLMWVEKSGYKVKEFNFQEGEVVGIKIVMLEVEGEYVFGYLKGENGIYCLVCVSFYNLQGKCMMFFVLVYVYFLVDDIIEIYINLVDIFFEIFCLGGVGGQNVNKVEIVVCLCYVFLGIIIENFELCLQLVNKEKVMQLFCFQLYEIEF